MGEATLVDMLYESRRAPRELVLDAGLTFEQALALQLEVADRFAADGDAISGWKVGMSSGRGRDLMGEGFRPFGYVLASRVFGHGETVTLSGLFPALIEPELCVVLGETLAGEVTPDEARAATRGVAPAFEVIELRVPGGAAADHATLIADGIGQSAVVIGTELPLSALPDRLTVELFREEEQVARETTGETLEIDDPFLALARVATLLAKHGRHIEAGQPVLTGSFAAVPVEASTTWRATFSGLGEVSITFAESPTVRSSSQTERNRRA